MEEVVRETIRVWTVHSRTSGRRPTGSLRRGRLLSWGPWLGSTMVLDGLGGGYGSRVYD